MTLTQNRNKKTRKILETIYTEGPISRIDLSKKLQITPATTSELTNYLIDTQIIEELGADPADSNVGRRKILLNTLPNVHFYLGVELTMEYIAITRTDNLGNITHQKIIYNNKLATITSEDIIDYIHAFILDNNFQSISAMGIAIPGYFEKKTRTIQTDFPFWSNFDLGPIIDAFPFSVYCNNKVSCIALYLRYFDHPLKTSENFTLYHIRSGMSSAYMYNGSLYGEHNPHVGEFGHFIIQPNGPKCQCGNHGCLQTYISQPWLIHKAQLLYDNHTSLINTLVSDKKEITLKKILLAYDLGDDAIIRIIDDGLSALATVIHNNGMIIDAYEIFIHGIMFPNENIKTRFLEYLSYQKEIFAFGNKKKYHFVPYTIHDGSIAGCAMAMYYDLLVEI